MTGWRTEPDGPGSGDDRYGDMPGVWKADCRTESIQHELSAALQPVPGGTED